MTNKEKKLLLKTAMVLVYKCSEHTPPEVKYSELNKKVASAAIIIGEIIKMVTIKPVKTNHL